MGFTKKEVTASVVKKLRLTPADAAEIEERARQACMTFSGYVRRCSLGRRTDTRYDVDSILALRDVVNKIRALYQDPRVELSEEEVRSALQEAVLAMKRV
ncbi:hypothetical protein [Burkholderia sp. L27(2015)]|uniref:plasmid mobilization protein n=1 Tax=Burkholderia sp. L27(2015) TaxID=1641858 RepID=UPI00131D2FF0|nr:hypothetical protein [Burkholderia sp. L27(2015)]